MHAAPDTRPSLLLRLRDRSDRQAWKVFVDLYGPLVYALGRRHGLQDADAADLTQDVFSSAAVRSLRYNPRRGSFRGWLYTVARSRLLDWQRRQRLRGSGDSAVQELLDSEYELTKTGYTVDEVNDALAFQKLKNEIIASPSNTDKWDEYERARAIAKDQKWFRHPGIDVRGPEKRDDFFWTYMRRFYVYDPAPALRASKAPLLAIFGDAIWWLRMAPNSA